MKTLTKTTYLFALTVLTTMAFAACSDDNRSDLDLDGSTMINAFRLDDFDADIDNLGKKLTVNVPQDYDVSRMKVGEISLNPGATADMAPGEIIDCSMPHNLRITNGDVFTDYTLSVTRDNVTVLAAQLGGKYAGTIDNAARTITFFVPLDEDVTAMPLSIEGEPGTVFDPASGSVLDLSLPVKVRATFRTCSVEYTLTAIKDDMSQLPKAFIGSAAEVGALGDEAKAAAEWMLANVPNSRYVALQSVLDGSVKLSDFKMIWCHFDWTDWPGVMWDTRDIFNDYYIKGGNILASRDGARYINDVWRVAKDQQSPNNMFGGDFYQTLEADLGFTVTGHEGHPLYSGLAADADGRILLAAAGCQNSNRTLQWGVDWDAYGSMQIWEERTGAKVLASGHDFDANRVTIAEFEPRDILDGYTSGRVLTIGTPAFEWHDPAHASNPYRENMYKLTKNAINYLCR